MSNLDNNLNDNVNINKNTDQNVDTPTNETKPMIVCENLVKIYKTSEIEVVALQGLDLTVEKGEMMAIIGNSGSGKSTLLNMLGGLDKPSAGSLEVDGKDLIRLSEKDLINYKSQTVGFVWQNNARNLIPYLSAKENIELIMRLNGKFKAHKAEELLDLVSMSHRKSNRLGELSGGEQQRVAIAIALANDPNLILADEPTGAVDTKTSDQIVNIFQNLSTNLGITIVIVTHDRRLSRKVNRVVSIRDGKTSSEFHMKNSYKDEIQSIGLMGEAVNAHENVEDETHEEFAVLDRVGRLQLPADYMKTLNLTGKDMVELQMEDGYIKIIPKK